MSKIEWTEQTWNPISGCSHVSTGCKNCYAEKMTKRLAKIESTSEKYGGLLTEKGKFNGVVKFDDKALFEPMKRRKPTMYFVNSMSDLFHENVPFEWIDKIMAVIALCPQHTFQVLTKRPERMNEYFSDTKFRRRIIRSDMIFLKNNDFTVELIDLPLPNLWLGVSVENNKHLHRIDILRDIPAAVRFISFEPLLSGIENIELKNIHWAIVGGESGRNARPMHPDWVRSIRDQCAVAKVPFFFKQWGEYAPIHDLACKEATANKIWHVFDPDNSVCKVGKKAAGRLLDGIEYNALPKINFNR